MKRFFILLAWFNSSMVCSAAIDPFSRKEIFSFESHFLPSVSMGSNNEGHIQPTQTQYRMGLKPIFSADKKRFISFSILYKQLSLDYDNESSPADIASITQLHTFDIPMFYRQEGANPDWSFLAFLTPGVSSDFKSRTFHGFHVFGGGVVEKKIRQHKIGLGLVVINNYGTPRIFPALSYEVTWAERHKLRLRAPTELAYYYTAHNSLLLGLMMSASGTHAYIHEPGPYHGKYLSYTVSRIGPTCVWGITNYLRWEIFGGWAYRHELNVTHRKENIKQYNLDSSAFLSTAIKIGW